MTFASLGLPQVILKGIRAAGLSEPTAIQSKAIPTILQGNDLIGVAPSGSGKTGTYLIPILARLLDSSTRLRCLILVPTREMAAYVETRCRDYARYTDVRVGVVFSGGPLPAQERMLREHEVDILVATPRRLIELQERRAVNFEYLEVLVLEEADRMVSMGMGPELRRLLKQLPETRQTLMFTMSLPPELNRLAKEALIEPVRVDLAPTARPGTGIRQVIYPVLRDLKPDFLNHMLSERELWGGSDVRSLVLFTRTRYGAEGLARQLHRRNYVTAVLDDYPSQQEREQALEELRRGRMQILVASDGAGRSLDLSGIAHVVNYHVPQTPEDYAHRLGRPGRPDASGDMFTLMSTDEQKDIAGIERLLGRTIERSFLPSFDYGMRPSEIRQVINYDDEWTRPRRVAGGIQSAAARIAGSAAARIPATPHMPAPPAPAIRPHPIPGMPSRRLVAAAPPKKPVATPGRPWLSPPKPVASARKHGGSAKHPAPQPKKRVEAKRPTPKAHRPTAGRPPSYTTGHPTSHTAGHPTKHPTSHPAGHPAGHPVGHPVGHPAGHPAGHPVGHPAKHPTGHPTAHPTGHPKKSGPGLGHGRRAPAKGGSAPARGKPAVRRGK